MATRKDVSTADGNGVTATRGVADLARDVATIDALIERIRRHAQLRWKQRRAIEAPRRHAASGVGFFGGALASTPSSASAPPAPPASAAPLPATLAQLLGPPPPVLGVPAAPTPTAAGAPAGTVARALKVVQLEYVIDDPSDIVVDVDVRRRRRRRRRARSGRRRARGDV